MKATIIDQSPLRLVTAKSKCFPEGNREAFDSIESQLETLRGRKFYGLVYGSAPGIDYYAGLVPDDEFDEHRFNALGFPTMKIAGGACVRVKLMDWAAKTDRIGSIFRTMIAEHEVDSSRPQIEFYRSSRELHLLLPVRP